mmetsp:Transcript_56909/g.132661  ORF Transcript_56909/g.132661 Transcript_56909/m.132661 type:complete len:441 (+) Transcript_56909:114-1436(+)
MRALRGALSRTGGKKDGKSEAQQQREEEERQAKEDKKRAKEEELQMELLPWNTGDYIKITLFLFIKLPFILSVGILATIVEVQVKNVNLRSWHRPTLGKGPSCFVTELRKEIFNYNTTLNDIFIDLGVGPIYNESNLVLGNSSHHWNFTLTESDECGIAKDNCSISTEANLVEDNGWFGLHHGGIAFGYFFPFAALWMLYKLVWIPLWPVDRFALYMAKGQDPPPQPVFRLVTQPYFQVCSKFLQVLMMILNMLRYVFLPNYLLLPLTSLHAVDGCPEGHALVYYRMDWIFGQAAYIWLIIDFVSVIGAYCFFKFVYGGKVIGTWIYRFYKLCWLVSCFTAITLFIMNLAFNFDMNLFRGLNFAILLTLDFNRLFHYSIDMLAFMAGANYTMEFLSLTYTIGGFLLPICCAKVPCVKKFFVKERPADPEEGRPLVGDRQR